MEFGFDWLNLKVIYNLVFSIQEDFYLLIGHILTPQKSDNPVRKGVVFKIFFFEFQV